MKAKTTTGARANRPQCELIAIGASAGGLAALIQLLDGIDRDFPAIVVVQHLDPRRESHLAELLSRKTNKNVREAEDGETLRAGTAYIGPPDEHILVTKGKVQLVHSRLIRFSRPSIDVMFSSVAATYAEHAIGVILSGSNRDGADGMAAIKRAGGVTIAQDPATAEYRVMPQAAIDAGCVDLVVPLDKMGKKISALIKKGTRRHG